MDALLVGRECAAAPAWIVLHHARVMACWIAAEWMFTLHAVARPSLASDYGLRTMRGCSGQVVTEHAAHTSGSWGSGIPSTADDPFEASRLASQMARGLGQGYSQYIFKVRCRYRRR